MMKKPMMKKARPFDDLQQEYGLQFPNLRGRLTANQMLAPISWFGVGGPAQLFFQPFDADDLAAFISRLPKEIPITIIGRGTNLLIRDGGIAGVTIRIKGRGFEEIEQGPDGQITAGAGVADSKLALRALEAGLDGFAFYAGIPGSVGGAITMNAGANAGETSDILQRVQAVDRSGEICKIDAEELGFAYRQSRPPKPLIFVSASFQGMPAPARHIREQIEVVKAHRLSAQPQSVRTGGSTFKNPPGQSAWKLIDAAGCRGMRFGQASVSEKHCNFLINDGGASAHDLEQLGETVRMRVHEHCGVMLEWEIVRLGEAADAEQDEMVRL